MVDDNMGGAQTDSSGTQIQSDESLTPPERDYKKDMLRFKDLYNKSQETINSFETRFQDLEIERAQSQGDKDKVIQNLQEELRKTKNTVRQSNYTQAKTNVIADLKVKAKEMNCIDPDLFISLVGDDRIGKVTVDGLFRPDPDEVNDLIDEKMKEFEHIKLFSKDVRITDRTPDNRPIKTNLERPKSLSEMSDEELKQAALNLPGERRVSDLG